MAKIICPNEEEWKAERMKGIGGSDAAVVMGASKWNSPYSLWALKSGLITDDDQSEPAYWGTIFEDPIRKHFCAQYEISVLEDEPFSMRSDEELPFLRASLDGMIPPGEDMSKVPLEVDSSTWGIYEGKTASQYMADYWNDGPPQNYYYQVMHYMMVAGAGYGIVSVLFGGNRYDVYLIKRDEAVIEVMRETEIEFWRRVQEEDPPEMDGHKETTKALNSIYDPDPEDEITLSEDAGKWDVEILKMKERIARSMERKSTLENKLRKELRNATVGYLPNKQFRYTYKADKNNSRVLRRSKA